MITRLTARWGCPPASFNILAFLQIAPIQAGETQSLPRLRRGVYSTRNTAPSYPRIPRLVSKNAKSVTSTVLESQFRVNTSHVQTSLPHLPHKPLHPPIVLPLGSQHARMDVQKVVQCQSPHVAV